MSIRLFNFSSIFVLSSLILSEPVFADDISHDVITATTSLRQWSSFSIGQITDGITADCSPTCNGFTTNAKSGRITFSFETPHDIDGIKIWNDVNIRKEGIKDFMLELRTAEGESSSSPEFTAVSGQADAQYFEFPPAENITEIDLIVLSSLLEEGPTRETRTFAQRIEVREVTFTGTPSATVNTPELSFNPSTLIVNALGTGTSILTGLDDFELESEPIIQCTNGGSFAGSTFRAPPTRNDTVSICTATVRGPAGNVATAQLQITIKPLRPSDPVVKNLSFTPASLKVTSGTTGRSALKIDGNDNLNALDDLNVSCTNGGSYSGGIFVAPTVTVRTISVCEATAIGAVRLGELRVEIQPEEKKVTLPPILTFSPSTLQIKSGGRGVSNFTAKDDTGIPRAPVITCTNGGTFNNPNFTAPNVFITTTSLCTASVTNASGIAGKGVLTAIISPPEIAPTLSFNPNVLSLDSAKSTHVSIVAPEGTTPQVSCNSGGTFDGTSFTAPTATKNITSQCTAVVTDAAGNKLQSSLSVSIRKSLDGPSWNPILWGLGGLGLLGLGGLLWRGLRPKKHEVLSRTIPEMHPPRHSMRPSKPLERPENVGTIFAGSPLLAANVAAPLSSAGQLTASSLQMLSGPFAALRPAYRATGRIGYAQEGVPTSEDYSFGTGFLVSSNHVMTNRHVHGFYSEYLTGEDCGGIEFIAEKDKDASDFYEFDGKPPLLVPGLDIAIYTLAKPVQNREPIARIPLETDSFEGREIVVVGYPDTFNPNDPDILAALEENPVFAVKRVSQGQIFRHSTDTDNPYGVEAMVTESERSEFPMPAISHNASTMTGNSGSPILDAKTGELLGVHFAGYKIFNKKEAANLAMAIAYIIERHDANTGSEIA